MDKTITDLVLEIFNNIEEEKEEEAKSSSKEQQTSKDLPQSEQ